MGHRGFQFRLASSLHLTDRAQLGFYEDLGGGKGGICVDTGLNWTLVLTGPVISSIRYVFFSEVGLLSINPNPPPPHPHPHSPTPPFLGYFKYVLVLSTLGLTLPGIDLTGLICVWAQE